MGNLWCVACAILWRTCWSCWLQGCPPLALAVAIRTTGRDVRHTLDLPRANATADDALRELVLNEDRIITKDRGFRAPHVLSGRPK